MAIGKQLSDGNPDGTVLGQNAADLVGFHGVTGTAQYTFVSALATCIAVKGTVSFGFSTSTKLKAMRNLVADLRAWAVSKGFGA